MAAKAPFLKVPCSTSTFWYTSTPAETCRGIPPYHVSEIRMVWQLGAAVQSSNVFFQRLQFHMSYHPTERLPARSENVPAWISDQGEHLLLGGVSQVPGTSEFGIFRNRTTFQPTVPLSLLPYHIQANSDSGFAASLYEITPSFLQIANATLRRFNQCVLSALHMSSLAMK